MKIVVVRRDADGRPVWQADYAEFMGVVGDAAALDDRPLAGAPCRHALRRVGAHVTATLK